MTTEPTKTHRPRTARRWIALPAAVLGALVLLLAGTAVVIVAQGKAAPAGGSGYVALGSSFGAGPGITTRAAHSPVLCDRSEDNYAHLVARARNLDLTDMTCSGAVSSDVLDGGQYFQGPQLRAVRPTTKVVTITIGGNDVFYLGNLFAWSCAKDPDAVPVAYRLVGVCDEHSQAAVSQAFAELPANMTAIADNIHAVAPRAQVVFVDYTTVLPDSGTYPALPITDAQADEARAVAAKLQSVTAEVAAQTGSTLVKASEVTRGHDVCSTQPWVYGFQWGSNPLEHSVLPYHPRAAAMQNIAIAVARVIN